ncbi:hypothetical protein OH768_29840 [Streptomyces sp. NBC_01622]|uniref:hypothetical protein n=1 Tax=Streptomyces sp. NBC_01622 TaxID=2975903 RepID=UPI003863BD43|nr:hypothetical protein OH768_29840 [Streptomyces sp. NBC_01622]
MRFRVVLIVLFLIPLLWGTVSLLRAGSAYGAYCPGALSGADGESHPDPMRPGDRCELSYDTGTGRSIGTSTYEQVMFGRELKRRSLYQQGTLFTLYGTAGMGIVVVATRKRGPAA